MMLRKLEKRDAPLMLEWMHDESVAGMLRADFSGKTLVECEDFIAAAEDTTHNLHMAIVDDEDIYMGTVSLKNIENGSAEFAIVVRRTAMRKGFSRYGMEEMIKIGLADLKLNYVYWCVAPDNRRAVRFYDKNGFHKVSPGLLKIRGGTARNKFGIIFGTEYREYNRHQAEICTTKYSIVFSSCRELRGIA